MNNSLALIAKNFKKMWKQKNFNKPKKTSTSVAPTAQKGCFNPNSKCFDLSKLEGIQCNEYEGIGHIQAQCANTLAKNKAMQSTRSDDYSNDSIDEEDLVGGLVTHDDVKKETNGDIYESNVKGASSSKTLHIARYKEDTSSYLDTTMQHDNKNDYLDSDDSEINVNDRKAFYESYRKIFVK